MAVDNPYEKAMAEIEARGPAGQDKDQPEPGGGMQAVRIKSSWWSHDSGGYARSGVDREDGPDGPRFYGRIDMKMTMLPNQTVQVFAVPGELWDQYTEPVFDSPRKAYKSAKKALADYRSGQGPLVPLGYQPVGAPFIPILRPPGLGRGEAPTQADYNAFEEAVARLQTFISTGRDEDQPEPGGGMDR